MISIIISILILGVLVTVHEAGHFFFARKMGVFVKEFAVGFPPRIFKKTKKGTLYSIGMIPFGGFVRLLGEDENEKNESLHGKNYQSLIWYKKIPILLGGIFANLVFAWLIMWGLFSYGMNIEGKVPLEFKKYATVEGEPSVLYIAKDSLAELSKIEKGDRILSITALSRNEEVLETVKNPDIETIKRIIKKDSENVILDLLKKSTGEKDKVIVNRGELEKHGNLLGIYIDNTYHVKIPIIKALGVSLLYTGDQFSQMFFGIAEFFKNIFLLKSDIKEVSGPVGIINAGSSIAKEGLSAVMLFIAFLSINLAALNMLPIPGLDGYHVLITTVEGITKRKINTGIKSVLIIIGIVFILGLSLFVTYFDIAKLLQ